MTKREHGKEKVVPCACTESGCTCKAYIAPKGISAKKIKKRCFSKISKKPQPPREIILPIKARIISAVLKVEFTVGDKVIESEVEIPGDQLK